jgi:hypothetical protein
MSLRIAIDYDDTFTADPVFWAKFIGKAREFGHLPMIVTCRHNTPETLHHIDEHLEEHGCMVPVFMSSLVAKRPYMEDRGINVDIWIDDKPESVKEGR